MLRAPAAPVINPAQTNEQGGMRHRGAFGAGGGIGALPEATGPVIGSVGAPAGPSGGGAQRHLNPDQFKDVLDNGGEDAGGGAAADGAEAAAAGGGLADLAVVAAL